MWSRRPVDSCGGAGRRGALAAAAHVAMTPDPRSERGSFSRSGRRLWAIYIVAGQKAGVTTAACGRARRHRRGDPCDSHRCRESRAGLFALAWCRRHCSGDSFQRHSLYARDVALRRLPTHTFGSVELEPALGAVIGFVMLQEKLAPLHIAAICSSCRLRRRHLYHQAKSRASPSRLRH